MGIKISALTEALATIATDIFHLRTTGGIDKKITSANLFDSDMSFDGTKSGDPIFSGQPTFSLGKKTTAYLEQTNPQANDIFDALDSYIPDAGNSINVHGGGNIYPEANKYRLLRFNRATRINATMIYIYYHYTELTFDGAGAFQSITGVSTYTEAENGDADNVFQSIGISW